MRKIKIARTDAAKITRPKLGRTLLRPLGLAELGQVAGADGSPGGTAGGGDVETDGIWSP